MRFLPLFLCLAACGGTRPPASAAATAHTKIAPAYKESAPSAPENVEDEEAPTPTLRVTKLSPTPVKSKTVAKPELLGELTDGGGEGASIDEPGKRPLLALQGTPSRENGRENGRESAEASSTWNRDPNEPRPSALDPQARASYKNAYRIFQAKKPREALDAFAAFVLKYPDHPYVEQATYWRGECYVALGDKPRALEQFQGVVARFPGTPKAHEAEGRIASLQNKSEGVSR